MAEASNIPPIVEIKDVVKKFRSAAVMSPS
jgi:hypothetical protein